MSDPILFYSTRGEWGRFSNFAATPFTLDGKRWRTSEHCFQAAKFPGHPQADAIHAANSPAIAARLGRSRKAPLRPDWESVKEDVMRRALAAKFAAHGELRELLLSTGDAELIEHTRRDAYWGDGGDGHGRNRLGHLLMELRERLRAEGSSADGGDA